MAAPPKARIRTTPLLIQAVVAALLIALVVGAVSNAQENLERLGLTSGFGFLERTVGWGYSFSLIERSIEDTYARTFLIGFMNTLFVGLIAIVTSTILGVAIGTLRDVQGLALRSAADMFVHVFRNIPLILQLVFTYAVLIHMPGPRQAMDAFGLAFLSNRGLMLPGMNVGPGEAVVMLLAFVLVLGLILRFSPATMLRRMVYGLASGLIVLVLLGLILRPEGEALISVPALKGLRFRGGITISIELVAMLIALTLYGSAYIAEVVRGGLKQVSRGQIEAGRALGLSEVNIWRHIKLPMALRSILPPLGNQWIFIMKSTTLGVAIGFSDLFYLISTSITQSGQTLELILLLMLSFLLINYTLAQLVNLMNARLALKGH